MKSSVGCLLSAMCMFHVQLLPSFMLQLRLAPAAALAPAQPASLVRSTIGVASTSLAPLPRIGFGVKLKKVAPCSASALGSFGGGVLDALPGLEIARAATDPAVLREIEEAAMNSVGRDVLIFLSASVAVVPLSRLLNVTPVLGFLAMGCALGPHGLGMFANSEADLELGDIGILFLLFNEGLNLAPERLKELGSFFNLGASQLVLSMGLFFFGTLLGGPLVLQYVGNVIPLDKAILLPIVDSPVVVFCIAAAGALSSSAFVLPVIKQKGWEDRPEGIAALSVLLLQDLAVAPLLVLLPLVAGTGPQSAGELGLLVAKATFGFGAVLAAGSVIIRKVFDVVAAARSTETFVAAALLVALGMGQVADYLGLSPSTGAFAAGVLLAGNRYRAQIQADVKPFEGILLGVFFLTAGATLDPNVVVQEFPTLVTGIAAFIVTKAAVLFAAGPALGEKTPAQAARVAITLSGGGEFAFVIFKLAEDLKVLPYDLANLLTASVVISMSLTPLLGELADMAGDFLESSEGAEGDSRRKFLSADAERLFDKLDTDNSGTIEFEELRIALHERGVNYSSIANIFAAFDVDGSGSIDREEWEAGLQTGILNSALAVSPEVTRRINAEDESGDETASDAIVICGFAQFGQELYGVLESAGLTDNGGVIAFDLNPSRVAACVLAGSNVIYGDGASVDLFRAAGVTEPRAVVITYRSEQKRLETTSRLREALPKGTPIYARAVSGQGLGVQELMDAGATAVVSERTESAMRVADFLGARSNGIAKEAGGMLGVRELLPTAMESLPEVIPGLTESALSDLAEEVGRTPREVERLYTVFSSLPGIDVDDEEEVSIAELRDVLLRTDDAPIDDDAVKKWMELSDDDKDGTLSFAEFAHAYFDLRKATAAE